MVGLGLNLEATMTPLRQRMVDEMTLRGMSERTKESYLGAVSGLAKYYRRSPDQVNIEEVRQYLLHLERERRLSWSSLNVAVSGLRFLYFTTLKWELTRMDIPPRKAPSRLPEVLSREEVDRLLAAADNPKHRVVLMTIYAAGLRLNEALHLRVHDIDSSRMTIRVEQGKGRKDRYTVLSVRLLEELRIYWKQHPSRQYLFFGVRSDQPVHETVIQRAYKRAKVRAGIQKGIGVHTLRHCFATHLLEAGADVRTIQVLLGHTDLRTTTRYLQIRQPHIQTYASKFDLLAVPSKAPGI
jgi:site-specific recombinase XerD